MRIHEFGKDNKQVIILVHPSVVRWDYFEFVIPLLEKKYRVIVPALPGYDEEGKDDFTSVEQISADLADWLKSNGMEDISCIYGCSMGGSVVVRMLADNRLKIRNAVIDGGITPYRLPWILTRLIAVKDFLLIWRGKLGGMGLLEKAFSTDAYSEEDLQYIADVLRTMSAKTIWRTFESCNNYTMPVPVKTSCERIEYWYAEAEEKDRKKDLTFIRDDFPQARILKYTNLGHGGLAVLKPGVLAKRIEDLCERDEIC